MTSSGLVFAILFCVTVPILVFILVWIYDKEDPTKPPQKTFPTPTRQCAPSKSNSVIDYKIDLSGKRNVTEEKLICLFIDEYGFENIEEAKRQNENILFVIEGTRNSVYQYHHKKYSMPTAVITAEVTYDKLKAVYDSDISKQHERAKLNSNMRLLVKQRDDYTCQYCGKRMLDGVGLQIDHIIPIAKGGKTELNNLQVLCSVCNRRKSDKIVPEAKKVQQTSEQDFQAYMRETREYIKSFQQKKKEDE